MARDPVLCRQYEGMVALDSELRGRASTLTFTPRASLGVALRRRWHRRALFILAGVLCLRLLVKLAPFTLGIGISASALAVALCWGLPYLLASADSDRQDLLRGLAVASR